MNQAPKPGTLVTDELGRIIVSYSSITQFRNCRRKYYWNYIKHIVPLTLKASDPRNNGKCIHGACEALRDDRNVNDEIDAFWGDQTDTDHDAFEWRERARVAMAAYRARWHNDSTQADFHWDLEVLEGRFTGDIVDPATGAIHPRYSIGGKMDLAVRVKEPCYWGTTQIDPGLWLGEIKTWAKIDGSQLSQLWSNFQIMLYSHYLSEAFGEPVQGVLYDIIGKAKSIEHTEAETQADFDQRVKELRVQAEAGELARRLKQKAPKGKPPETDAEFLARRIEKGLEEVQALQPIERETDESFHERLDNTYRNPNMLHREVVPIDLRVIENIRAELWETLIQHDEAASRDRWGQNESTCYDFFRPCDYLQICKSMDNPITIQENYRIRTPHSEQADNPHLPIVQ